MNRSGNKIIAYYLWCDGRRDLSKKYCNVEEKRDINLMCLLSFCKYMLVVWKFKVYFVGVSQEKKVCNLNTKKINVKMVMKLWWRHEWVQWRNMRLPPKMHCASIWSTVTKKNYRLTENECYFSFAKTRMAYDFFLPFPFFFRNIACQHRFAT